MHLFREQKKKRNRAKYTQDTWLTVKLTSDRARLGKYLKRPQARKYKIHSKEKGTGNERECKRKDVGEENMFIL